MKENKDDGDFRSNDLCTRKTDDDDKDRKQLPSHKSPKSGVVPNLTLCESPECARHVRKALGTISTRSLAETKRKAWYRQDYELCTGAE
jgi:hypothetical protein